MVDVYSGEPERQAALAEVTRLRREFDTTTAKGAKAFAASKEAQAAMKRLDKAKSAAGMRTRAEDLAALNKLATSDTATMKKDAEGRMTAAPTKAERAVTKQLNQPSKQYFKQVQQAYKNPDKVPTWKAPKEFTQEDINFWDNAGIDTSKARYDWVWFVDRSGKGQWAMSPVGLLKKKPSPEAAESSGTYATDMWYSDSVSLGEAAKIHENRFNSLANWDWGSPGVDTRGFAKLNITEVAEALPEIKFSEFQEIYYRLTVEGDQDITIEDVLDKYDELYGEG
jgi:hypothetical protein